MAFAVAPATVGPTYILRNVTYRVGNTRTSQIDGYTASALKINRGYSTPIGPLYLYHNTFYNQSPNTDALALLNPGESTFIIGRNNLMLGTRYAIYKVNPVALVGPAGVVHQARGGLLVAHGNSRGAVAGAGVAMSNASSPFRETDAKAGIVPAGVSDQLRGTTRPVDGDPGSFAIREQAVVDLQAGVNQQQAIGKIFAGHDIAPVHGEICE